MHCKLTPLARSDLKKIGDMISSDNPKRALTFVEELEKRCKDISNAPMAYPRRIEISPNMRSVVHKNYSIFYSIQDEYILIERILNNRQSLSKLFH